MTTDGAKDQLLATIGAERARWEALLEEIGEERMTTPGVVGDWSVKDLLGHLTAYTRRWGAEIRGVTTGVPPTMRDLFDADALPEGAATWTQDEQNAAIRAQYAPLSLPVVLAKWRDAWDLLMEGISTLTDADVTAPGRVPGSGDRPLAKAMAGDTYGHAAHHAAEVRAWLDG